LSSSLLDALHSQPDINFEGTGVFLFADFL
jgi:hypothetical protein